MPLKNNHSKQRIYSIDLVRGCAVFLMIVYHFFFDYGYFGYWDINLNAELGWRIFRYTIMSLFLFTVGMSLNLHWQKAINISSVIKRVFLLGGASALISAVSFIQFPESWIYFGIIHFILLASLSGLFFRRVPNVCLYLALLILIAYNQGYLHTEGLYQLLKPALNLPNDTEDLVPFFPWFSVVLLGMYFSYYRFYDLSDCGIEASLAKSANRVIKVLLLTGRHALLIYLIHQPILFAGFFAVSLVA